MAERQRINPCKECIVTSMCRTGCDELAIFIKDNTGYTLAPMGYYQTIAKHVRKDKIRLYYNNYDQLRWYGGTYPK